jgi:hypothetical protein
VSEFWGIKPWGKDCWCRHYTGVGRLGGESIGSEVWGRKFCGVKYIGVYVKYIGLGSIQLGWEVHWGVCEVHWVGEHKVGWEVPRRWVRECEVLRPTFEAPYLSLDSP